MWRQQRLEAGQRRKSWSDESFRSRADHGDDGSQAQAEAEAEAEAEAKTEAQAQAEAVLFVVGWRVCPGAGEFLVVGFVVSQFLVVGLLLR
jgi:regulator of protease activity HflC (stomatin/prohibitin superfamily)